MLKNLPWLHDSEYLPLFFTRLHPALSPSKPAVLDISHLLPQVHFLPLIFLSVPGCSPLGSSWLWFVGRSCRGSKEGEWESELCPPACLWGWFGSAVLWENGLGSSQCGCLYTALSRFQYLLLPLISLVLKTDFWLIHSRFENFEVVVDT